MEKMPLVSVIIATYNHSSFILKAVRSVLEQTYENLEILIINDCSTDKTREILRGVSDPRFKAVNLEKNIGRSAARNLGIKKSLGEYVAVLDSDDFWYREKLAKQIAYMRLNGLFLCGTWACAIDSEKGRLEWRQPEDSFFIKRNIIKSNMFINSTIVGLKGVFDEFGGYKEYLSGSEDYDLYLQIVSKYRTGNYPEVLAEYNLPKGFKYTLKEQYYTSRVRFSAVFNYGYSKKFLIYALTPLISLFVPRKLKILLKSLFLKRAGKNGKED